MESEITCIICPVGCKVTIKAKDGDIINIEGHQCKKGIGYVKEELFDPRRTLTTTMMVKNGKLPLVSVKTAEPIPKDKLFEVMDVVSQIKVDAPVNIRDILVKNVLGLDVNIVATKKIDREKG
ncbi:MAG: DUF1667 domain-containing protein [Methanomassiliicoccales archaeon]|nr:MAG: DUF1667 domain-containing protein [Methanomassiliicoccales archaeon]